jgi:hypothetical protein
VPPKSPSFSIEISSIKEASNLFLSLSELLLEKLLAPGSEWGDVGRPGLADVAKGRKGRKLIHFAGGPEDSEWFIGPI